MLISRRKFLQSTGALALGMGITPLHLLGQTTQPAPSIKVAANGKTLVALFLRGGIDGLNLVVPHGDEHYYKHRKGLAIAKPGANDAAAIDLDNFFGLHPRCRSLKPLFEQNHAVALQAVGYPNNTRSHFEEQDTWETGVSGNTLSSDGWLNRHLQTTAGAGPIRAVALSDTMPRMLRGKARAYAMQNVDSIGLPQSQGDAANVVAALDKAYSQHPHVRRAPAEDLLASTGQATLEALDELQRLTAEPYEPKADYGENQIGRRLRDAARLIKADLGLEVIVIDYGDWDTHQNQGNEAGGRFGNQVEQLSNALAAFHIDLGDRMNDTMVLTLSDFGRTVRENGTGGTDHGWANAMLALGGPIHAAAKSRNDKPVVGRWPGLAPDQLNDGRDLQHTTDFRDVLAEVAAKHLGNPNVDTLLPDYTPKPVGMLTT